jgi:hypothetical protein
MSSRLLITLIAIYLQRDLSNNLLNLTNKSFSKTRNVRRTQGAVPLSSAVYTR